MENKKQVWAEQMISLLVEINRAVKATSDGSLPEENVSTYIKRYDDILAIADIENRVASKSEQTSKKRGRVAKSKARYLIDRMKNYKVDIFRFMTNPSVPFDNNQAERDIRMSKLHQKISGSFRSVTGNEAFGNIRSYISSANKQGVSMFDSIYAAVSGNPLFSRKS